MRRILPVESIRLEHNADSGKIVIRQNCITQHLVQYFSAARLRRLLLHVGIDALTHILTRLLHRLIAADDRL